MYPHPELGFGWHLLRVVTLQCTLYARISDYARTVNVWAFEGSSSLQSARMEISVWVRLFALHLETILTHLGH